MRMSSGRSDPVSVTGREQQRSAHQQGKWGIGFVAALSVSEGVW